MIEHTLIHRTSATSEEDIHHNREYQASNVHPQRAAKKNATPYSRVRFVNLLKANFSPSMCKINKKDETKKKK